MYKIFKKNSSILGFGIMIFLLSCQERDITEIVPKPTEPVSEDVKKVLVGLADIEFAIVSDWANNANLLDVAAQSFTLKPDAQKLIAAQNAWRKARDPWESNEAFAFGPVGSLGIDGNSDTWPLATNDLKAIVKSTVVLNDAFIAKMNTTTKGFHAIEFFLFGEKGTKKVGDFSARELTLLSLLTKDLKQESNKLKEVWTKGKSSFADSFIKAGSGSDLYPKASDALAEITGSMVGICTELPDNKMEEPLKRQDNNYAESAFSDYSLNDYRSNIVGVQAAYLGKYNTLSTASISDLVKVQKPKLDEKLRTQFELTIAYIELIPQPFSQAIINHKDKIVRAQNEIRKLRAILENEVTPLL